jgi:glycosyltransferase involved in cell wall biosynthesis
MRIALITEVWHPSVNGVVTRLDASIDGLLQAGHEVLVITPRTGPADDRLPAREHGHTEREGPARREAPGGRATGVTVVRVPSFRFGFIYGGQPWGSPLARVRRPLEEFAPDLVHVVSPFVLGIAGVRAAKRLGLPLVASFHTDIATYAGSYRLGWARPFIWGILRRLHNAAELNIVTSRHSKALLERHGIHSVVLWRPGVDLTLFHPRDHVADPTAAGTGFADSAADGPPETRAGAAGERPRALYVGRIADEKRLDALVPLARSGRVTLHLVGDGPDRARLERELAGTGTVFHGTVTGEELAAVYASSDVFVFPSTTETLGLVIIEALASGLPVVAVHSPASRELLTGVSVARLVPADRPDLIEPAVLDLLAVGTAAERADAARARAAGWDWPLAANQLLGYYEGVLAARRAASALAAAPTR